MSGFMAHATLCPCHRKAAGDNTHGPVSVRLDLGMLTCEVHSIFTCHKICPQTFKNAEKRSLFMSCIKTGDRPGLAKAHK